MYMCIVIEPRAHHTFKKTRWHDISSSLLGAKWGEIWETSEELETILMLANGFPLIFHKTKMLLNKLKKDAINMFGIEYGISKPSIGQILGTLELLVSEYGRTKTSKNWQGN